MGEREDLEWKIGICDDQLSNFESFKKMLREEVGLDLDTPYTDPADRFDDPLAQRIFGKAQNRFMESRKSLYSTVEYSR